MPHFTRLLAIGLLNYADDHGYFWANPLMIRGALFPFDEDSSNVRRALAQLAEEGYLKLGKTGDGREAGHIVNFSKHQRVDKPTDSEIQPLVKFDERSTNVLGVLDERSCLDRKGREGIGKDRNTLPATPAKREPNAVFDALCEFEGIPLNEVGSAGARIGVAMKAIKSVSPDVTADEIAKRGQNYRLHFSGGATTATALSKHWGKCHAPPPAKNGAVPWQNDSHNTNHDDGFFGKEYQKS